MNGDAQPSHTPDINIIDYVKVPRAYSDWFERSLPHSPRNNQLSTFKLQSLPLSRFQFEAWNPLTAMQKGQGDTLSTLSLQSRLLLNLDSFNTGTVSDLLITRRSTLQWRCRVLHYGEGQSSYYEKKNGKLSSWRGLVSEFRGVAS